MRPGYGSLAASDRTLPVTCMAVAHLMPEGAMLDATSEPARQLAVDHVRAGVLEAQSLGVPDVYLAPPATPDAPAIAAYRESALTLADEANRAGVRLGIEHFPGRGLPTVRQTLDFITACGHDNLYMLLDIGHNQIAGESVAESIQAAGDRLQYVHLNDNDAQSDLHVGLLEGVQAKPGFAMPCARWSKRPTPARSASKSTWQCPIHGPPPPAACRSCGGSNPTPRLDQPLGTSPRSTAPHSRNPWA